MVRVGMCLSGVALLLMAGCGWVDSTGRQTNSAPVVSLSSLLVDENSTIEIDLSEADGDGNLTLIEFALLESGSSLAGNCEALFDDMAVFSPTDYAPDIASACGEVGGSCELVFAESKAASDVYVASVPVLQQPTALKYRLTLADTDAASTEDEFTLCVRSISEPPVAAPDVYEVEYATERVVADAVFDDACGFSVRDGVMLNDADDFDILEAGLADNGCLDVTLVDPPQYHDGSFALSGLGGFSYQPIASAVAGVSDSFTYQLSDGLNSSETVTVTLNVVEQGSNTAPVALSPSVETPEDTAVDLGIDALATDDDGHAVQLQSAGEPENGVVAFDASSLRYTPNADYFGADSISYTVRDAAGATVSGTVAVEVTALNDRPTVSAVDSTVLSFSEAGQTQTVYVDVQDVETPLAELQLEAQSADPDVATAIAVLATGFEPDGNVQVAVSSMGEGTTSVLVNASDGELTGTETLTVSVQAANTPPVAAPHTGTVVLGGRLTINVVGLGLVSDADGDSITLTSAALEAGSADTTGQVQTLSNNRIRYTPGVAGTHVVEYTVSDGTDTASSTWTVTVTAPNTPPVANDTGTAGGAPGSELRFDVVANGSASDADVGDTLALTAVNFAFGSADATGVLGFDGSEIVYTPGSDGERVIEFEVSDGVDTATGSVTITVLSP